MALYQTSYTVEHFHAVDGTLLSGGTLEYYVAGTTEPTSVYNIAGTEIGATVTLNARGEPEASGSAFIICLESDINYKVVAKYASGATAWTIDNMASASASGGSSVEIANADFSQWPTISVNASDTDHDIDFAAGRIADTTGAALLILASTMVKRIDAAWSAGTNQGGLFSGTVANSTTYYAFLIEANADGSIDCGFDTSSVAANIPAGYTKYRRIASFSTDGSANIDSTSIVPLLNAEIAKRGENNGTASLNSSGEVPDSQLRSEIIDAASVVEISGTNVFIKNQAGVRKIKIPNSGNIVFADGAQFNGGPL